MPDSGRRCHCDLFTVSSRFARSSSLPCRCRCLQGSHPRRLDALHVMQMMTEMHGPNYTAAQIVIAKSANTRSMMPFPDSVQQCNKSSMNLDGRSCGSGKNPQHFPSYVCS